MNVYPQCQTSASKTRIESDKIMLRRAWFDCENYDISVARPNDDEKEKELLEEGFRFLDRVFVYEIDLRKARCIPSYQSIEAVFFSDYDYDQDIYSLAYEAFSNDRRFHLEPLFDLAAARAAIYRYINELSGRQHRIYKVKHGDELLGFTIVDEKADTSANSFENMLGATKPGIKGKMIAGLLYTSMLLDEASHFRKYIGRVSSSNIASINLHNRLGGHVVEVYDEFIMKKG